MNEPKPHKAAIRAAEKLQEKFDVGEVSYAGFETEFFKAKPSDIAQIITREYEPIIKDAIAALRSAKFALGKTEEGTVGARAQWKILQALNQLTT